MADKYEFQLVNDNCHALGAEYNNDDQYAVKYADIVSMSFHPVKHITTGEGGAILTNNLQLDEKVKILRTHGITKDSNIFQNSINLANGSQQPTANSFPIRSPLSCRTTA